MSLVNDYEIKNNFEYDLVVNGRFDICWTRPYDFSKLDNNKFHIPSIKMKDTLIGVDSILNIQKW